MYAVKTNIIRRRAGGQRTIYQMTGKTAGSDIVYIEGVIKTAAKDASFEIGERIGEDNIYKHFIFQNSLNVDVVKIVCKLRIPKSIPGPMLKTEEGIKINLHRLNEDDDFVYYKFFIDTLKPIRIEYR